MRKRPDLPAWPRGLTEPLAAAYVGLSEAQFRAFVTAGEAPAQVRFPCRRVVWLREDLDAWLDRLAGRAAPSPEDDVWAA